MTKVLGIDPGAVSGGLAIVEINNGAARSSSMQSAFLSLASKQSSASMF